MSEMTLKLIPIINRAVRRAQEENRKAGIPNVFSIDGKLFWQMPDGTILNHAPEKR